MNTNDREAIAKKYQTFTTTDFARRIGVSRSTVQRWDRDKILPARRTLGGRRFYTQFDVEEYFRATCKPHDGKWYTVTFDDGDYREMCSVCGAMHELDDNYCRCCGARMVWDVRERAKLFKQGETLNGNIN